MKCIDWKEAHHWLRGYSDALAGKTENPLDPTYADAYHRGYTRGVRANFAADVKALAE